MCFYFKLRVKIPIFPVYILLKIPIFFNLFPYIPIFLASKST